MHDAAVNHGQHGLQRADRLVGHAGGVEIVRAQHGEVCVLAFVERSEMVVVEAEPGRAFGVEAQRFQPRDLLFGVRLDGIWINVETPAAVALAESAITASAA